jgi:hypothetical protein
MRERETERERDLVQINFCIRDIQKRSSIKKKELVLPNEGDGK